MGSGRDSMPRAASISGDNSMGGTSDADMTHTTGTPFLRKMWLSHVSDHQGHLSTAVLEAGISMKDVESRRKQFAFLWSAFCSQWGDHHVRCVSEEGLNPSLYDLGLERPQVDTLPYHNQLIDVPLQGSPTGTFNPSHCTPRGGDSCTPLAGKQPCHPHKGTLHPNSDSSGTMRNTASSSYPAIPRTCTHRMTNPSRLVCFPPNPMRFNG